MKLMAVVAALLVSAAPASGQDTSPECKIRVSRQPFSLNTVQQRYIQLQKQLSTGGLNSDAEGLLKGAESFTRKELSISDLELKRAITYRKNGDDLLVVEWTQAGGKVSVLLDDTPYLSIYYVRLPYRAVPDGKGLYALLSHVITWNKSLSLRPEEIEFNAFEVRGGVQEFLGSTLYRSASDSQNLRIAGVSDGDVSLCAKISETPSLPVITVAGGEGKPP